MLCCESTTDERSAGNPHATFCGSRGPGPRRPGGCGNGVTARLLGHRQTKGAATDKPDLLPPRHISTLPFATVSQRAETDPKETDKFPQAAARRNRHEIVSNIRRRSK